jgi:hypothetical protein
MTVVVSMPIKSKVVLSIAVVVASLGVAASAQARLPVEPGDGGSAVPRQPALLKSVTTRQNAGFSANSGVHVKSQAEARTE